jgi:hypothetical protein
MADLSLSLITLVSISTRGKIGISLVAVSVVSMVVFQVVAFLHTDWHYAGRGSSDTSQAIAFAGKSRVDGIYLVPIVLCGAAGVLCLIWPSRKPPKLNA